MYVPWQPERQLLWSKGWKVLIGLHMESLCKWPPSSLWTWPQIHPWRMAGQRFHRARRGSWGRNKCPVFSLQWRHTVLSLLPLRQTESPWGQQTLHLFFHPRAVSTDELFRLVNLIGATNTNQFLLVCLGCFNKILCANLSPKHLTQNSLFNHPNT